MKPTVRKRGAYWIIQAGWMRFYCTTWEAAMAFLSYWRKLFWPNRFPL